MKRGKKIDTWYPFFIDKWLFGSTRHELIIKMTDGSVLDLRGIWIDLLTLSKKDSGYIRANETTPYPLEQLAGMFCVPLDHLKMTIEIAIQKGKLAEVEPGGIYFVLSEASGDYTFSDRWKREITKESHNNSLFSEETSEKAEETSEKAEAILKDIKGEDIKGKDIRETLSLEEIISVWNSFASSEGLSQIKEINRGTKRFGHINALIKKKDFDFAKLLNIISQSPFLIGKIHSKDREPFFATFDWIIAPSNYQKIIEGNYIGRAGVREDSEAERKRMNEIIMKRAEKRKKEEEK